MYIYIYKIHMYIYIYSFWTKVFAIPCRKFAQVWCEPTTMGLPCTHSNHWAIWANDERYLMAYRIKWARRSLYMIYRIYTNIYVYTNTYVLYILYISCYIYIIYYMYHLFTCIVLYYIYIQDQLVLSAANSFKFVVGANTSFLNQ